METSYTPTNPVTDMQLKPARATRCQWVAFWSLEHNECFYIGAKSYVKRGMFVKAATCGGDKSLIAPWRKVRSTRPEKRGSRSTAGIPKEQGEHGAF